MVAESRLLSEAYRMTSCHKATLCDNKLSKIQPCYRIHCNFFPPRFHICKSQIKMKVISFLLSASVLKKIRIHDLNVEVSWDQYLSEYKVTQVLKLIHFYLGDLTEHVNPVKFEDNFSDTLTCSCCSVLWIPL